MASAAAVCVCAVRSAILSEVTIKDKTKIIVHSGSKLSDATFKDIKHFALSSIKGLYWRHK